MCGLFSRIRSTIAVAGLFAVSVSTASAQDINLPYQRFVLSNGLTVLLHEVHKAPVVAVDIWYHVNRSQPPALSATPELKLPKFQRATLSNGLKIVLALNTKDLEQAGKSFFDPNRLVWVIVGDRSKIEAGVRNLNLGTLHFVDADGKSTD